MSGLVVDVRDALAYLPNGEARLRKEIAEAEIYHPEPVNGHAKPTSNGRLSQPAGKDRLEVGAKVRAVDRGNIGTVVADHGETVTVRFVSPEGTEATKEKPRAELSLVGDAPLTGNDADDLPVEMLSAGDLIAVYPRLHEPVIEGLLRRGETCNIIAAPKMRKSWLAYDLAISVAMGGDWLGRFPCRQGKVLLCDNELHAATLADRLRTVSDALMIPVSAFRERLVIMPLRGRLLDLNGIAKAMGSIEPDDFSLVILDALYRAFPAGANENDNAAIANLYNTMDRIAGRLNAAWVNVHHASKGEQAGKSVTDVGAGAGAQSRAADTHLILRPHENQNAVVLEAVVRSFEPVDPVGLKWTFPSWTADEAIDPRSLKGLKGKAAQEREARDKQAKDKILVVLLKGPQVASYFRAVIDAGSDRTTKLLDQLEIDGAVKWRSQPGQGRGGSQRLYWIADQPEPPTGNSAIQGGPAGTVNDRHCGGGKHTWIVVEEGGRHKEICSKCPKFNGYVREPK